MTPAELLNFFAPGLTATDEDKTNALALAESHRPWCLESGEQDEAQALYAAWLLTVKAQNAAGTVREVGVIAEQEGDVSRQYGKAEENLDAGGFKARYDAMARRCPTRMYRGACVK